MELKRVEVRRSKAFPEVPLNIQCTVRRSRIAARHGSGPRKSTGLTGNVGCSRAARCLRIVKNSLVSDKEFTLFCKS